MDGFNHILNWKLKRGSHPFPGKDGGTCINEAAVVAAGFEYRPISQPEDMPDCFSRPICALAMWLNDEASDDERQRLLPFVHRLACADTPAIEREREDYIESRIGRAVTFDRGLHILRCALAIGRQADCFGPGEVMSRLDAVRPKSDRHTTRSDTPLFAKVKSWLWSKETQSTP